MCYLLNGLLIPSMFFLPPDCSMNEENFSLRCPKHKVWEWQVMPIKCWQYRLAVWLWNSFWTLKYCLAMIFVLASSPRAADRLRLFTWSNQREAEFRERIHSHRGFGHVSINIITKDCHQIVTRDWFINFYMIIIWCFTHLCSVWLIPKY